MFFHAPFVLAHVSRLEKMLFMGRLTATSRVKTVRRGVSQIGATCPAVFSGIPENFSAS